MPEPTRYRHYVDPLSDCHCCVEPRSDGDYVAYADYAALREKAEAVVKHWIKGAPLIGTRDFYQALQALEESLQ